VVQQATLLMGSALRQTRGGRGPASLTKGKRAQRPSSCPAPPARTLRPRASGEQGGRRVSARLVKRTLVAAEEARRAMAALDDASLEEPQQQRLHRKISAAEWAIALERRCDSKSRGKIYDSEVGISCHFCRQKKLCGEKNCPRCSRRDPQAQCIGKSDCSKCRRPRGRFCRACLDLRYGQSLEDVRDQMRKGEWLCPHCYEEEHPEAGWICNSSICMKRRGMTPTGIAIYRAKELGFESVAHYLQSQILGRRAAAGAPATWAAGPSLSEKGRRKT